MRTCDGWAESHPGCIVPRWSWASSQRVPACSRKPWIEDSIFTTRLANNSILADYYAHPGTSEAQLERCAAISNLALEHGAITIQKVLQELRLSITIDDVFHAIANGSVYVDLGKCDLQLQHTVRLFAAKSVGDAFYASQSAIAAASRWTPATIDLPKVNELVVWDSIEYCVKNVGQDNRYRFGVKAELNEFASAAVAMLKKLPSKPRFPDVIANIEFFYVGSIGCTGVLKNWIARAYLRSLRAGRNEVTIDDLNDARLGRRALRTINMEVLACERTQDEDREGPGKDLMEAILMGLNYKPANGQLGSPAGKPNGQPKRKPFERTNVRDTVA